MSVDSILPIVIPGAMIQVGTQVYFIIHCWKNEKLTQRQKTLFTILISLFSLPAAAAYMLLRGRSSPPYNSKDLNAAQMDDGARLGIFVLLVIAYEALALNIMVNGAPAYEWLVSVLLGAVFVFNIIGGIFANPSRKLLYFALPAAQLLMILAVNYIDNTANSQFIVLAVLAGVINGFSLKYAKLYSVTSFVLYFTLNILKAIEIGTAIDQDTLVGGIYANTIIFIIVYTAFYAIKKQMLLNSLLHSALADVEQKSRELAEMGAIAERGRIAAEIHDTVGHKLTAAIVSIESGEKLLQTDGEEAKNKFALAKEQVRQGLSSIRMSVRAIKEGGEEDFALRVRKLAGQIEKDMGLHISTVIDLRAKMLPIQQSVLLQAITECATNSIKHGKSTRADLLVVQHKGTVRITFGDNGQSAPNMVFGFGLNNMRERVEALGGTMQAGGAEDGGFTVSIVIPIGTGGGL